MTPEMWTILGTGVAIIAVVLGSFRQLSGQLNGRLDQERAERRADVQRLNERLDGLECSMAKLRERMARLEGLLEGLRESITGRRAA